MTGETKYAFQNSWGVTARTIGIMSMIHGDDKGVVLPPKVAPKQVVIVPCGITNNKEEMAALMANCRDYEKVLEDAGIRVKRKSLFVFSHIIHFVILIFCFCFKLMTETTTAQDGSTIIGS